MMPAPRPNTIALVLDTRKVLKTKRAGPLEAFLEVVASLMMLLMGLEPSSSTGATIVGYGYNCQGGYVGLERVGVLRGCVTCHGSCWHAEGAAFSCAGQAQVGGRCRLESCMPALLHTLPCCPPHAVLCAFFEHCIKFNCCTEPTRCTECAIAQSARAARRPLSAAV